MPEPFPPSVVAMLVEDIRAAVKAQLVAEVRAAMIDLTVKPLKVTRTYTRTAKRTLDAQTEEVLAAPIDHPSGHPSSAAYTAGCRCEPCRSTHNAYCVQWLREHPSPKHPRAHVYQPRKPEPKERMAVSHSEPKEVEDYLKAGGTIERLPPGDGSGQVSAPPPTEPLVSVPRKRGRPKKETLPVTPRPYHRPPKEPVADGWCLCLPGTPGAPHAQFGDCVV
jgi:hypothetical protein